MSGQIFVIVQNIFYLQLWLGFQLSLIVISGLVFQCLYRFYGNLEVVANLSGMGKIWTK